MKKSVLISAILLISMSLLAQTPKPGAPKAIKYQAIVRDFSGEVVANNNNIRMKVTIRRDFANGTEVYSETHDCESNGIGMITFKIGGGTPISGSSFSNIPWGEAPLFAQMEIDINSTGYSNMGTAELVSVPYALYADNAGNFDLSSFGLNHNTVIKYDNINGTLANSAITEAAGAVTFNGQYTFPDKIGSNGHVLMVTDSVNGRLMWRAGGGGGGGIDPTFTGLVDGVYPRYDDISGRLTNGFIRQSFTPNVTTEPDSLVFSANMYSNKNLFIGGNTILKNLTINDYGFPGSKGTTNQILKFDGTNLIWSDMISNVTYSINRDASGSYIVLDSNGVSIDSVSERWISNNGNSSDNDIRYSAGNVVVGSKPQDAFYSALHVEKGDFVLASKNLSAGVTLPYDFHPANPNTPDAGIMWWGNRQAFRLGNLEIDGSNLEEAWDAANIGNHSIGLGSNTHVNSEYGFGIGKNININSDYFNDGGISFALGEDIEVSRGLSFGIGLKNTVEQPYAFAVGTSNDIVDNSNGELYSMAIGFNNTIHSAYGTTIGRANTINIDSDDFYTFGFNNNIAKNNTKSILIGTENIVAVENTSNIIGLGHQLNIDATNSIALGTNLRTSSDKNITIGHSITNTANNSIHIGAGNTGNVSYYDVIVGSDNLINNKDGVAEKVIIGSQNHFSDINDGTRTICIGTNNEVAIDNSIVIGTENATIVGNGNSVIIGNNNTNTIPNSVIIGKYNPIYVPGGLGGMDAKISIGFDDGMLNPFIMNGAGNLWLGHDGSITNGTLYAYGIETVDDGTIGGDLYITGTAYSIGGYSPSDYNLKSNIQPLTTDFSSYLTEIQPYSYFYTSDKDETLHWGFIAQDVQKYFPHLVKKNKFGLALNYTEFIPILWKISLEQQQRIDQQDSRIEELENQLQYILERLEELEKK